MLGMDEAKLDTMTIEELGLSTHVYKVLCACSPKGWRKIRFNLDIKGRVLVKSVIAYTAKDLVSSYKRGLWGFGPSSLKELEEKLAEHGLSLKKEDR